MVPILLVLLVGLAGCGSSATGSAVPLRNRSPTAPTPLATPPKTIVAHVASGGPYRAIKPGTIVPRRTVTAEVFSDARHGFGLALVDGEGFPAATADGGRLWRINGPVFFADAADGASGVSYTGIVSSRTYFAYGSSAVDVTTDGGRQWWSAYLGEVVLAVVAKTDELVAVVQQTPSSSSGDAADTSVYVSTDAGRRWRYDNQLNALVHLREHPPGAPRGGRGGRSACHAGQVLIPGRAAVGGILGAGVVVVTINNSSQAACTLDGYPTVSLLNAAGRRVSITLKHGALGPKEPHHAAPVIIGPNGRATFGLSFTDHSGPAPRSDCRRFSSVRVRLPGQYVALNVPLAISEIACGGRPLPDVFLSPIGAYTRP